MLDARAQLKISTDLYSG